MVINHRKNELNAISIYNFQCLHLGRQYIDHKDSIDLLFCKAFLTKILRMWCDHCLIFLESSSPFNLHPLTWPFPWTIPTVTSSFSFISGVWMDCGPMDGLEFVTLKCRRRRVESWAFKLINSHMNFKILGRTFKRRRSLIFLWEEVVMNIVVFAT